MEISYGMLSDVQQVYALLPATVFNNAIGYILSRRFRSYSGLQFGSTVHGLLEVVAHHSAAIGMHLKATKNMVTEPNHPA